MIFSEPQLFISNPANETCCILDDSYSYGYIKYHYHKEIQITLIISGRGVLQMGEKRYPFKKGEMWVIGSNQPHVFISDDECKNRLLYAHILFDGSNLYPLFSRLPEFEPMADLLDAATNGLQIFDIDIDAMYNKMTLIKKVPPFEKLMHVIQILYSICKQKKYWIKLNSGFSNTSAIEIDAGRLNRVFEYSREHYSEDIPLDQIASVVNLSRSAFCRFFKSHTHKSYMTFLTELRVNEACKKLLNAEKRISEIAYETGFPTPLAFNRAFKKIMTISPVQYRKQHKHQSN